MCPRRLILFFFISSIIRISWVGQAASRAPICGCFTGAHIARPPKRPTPVLAPVISITSEPRLASPPEFPTLIFIILLSFTRRPRLPLGLQREVAVRPAAFPRLQLIPRP